MTESILKDIINNIPNIFNHNIKDDINIDILVNEKRKYNIIFKIENTFYKYDLYFLINYWKNLNKEIQFHEFDEIDIKRNNLFNFPLENIFISAKDINLILNNRDIKLFTLKLEKKELNLSVNLLNNKINLPNSKLYKIDRLKMKKSMFRVNSLDKIKNNIKVRSNIKKKIHKNPRK